MIIPNPIPSAEVSTAKLALGALASLVAAGLLIFAVWFVFIHPHQATQAAAQAQTDTYAAQAAQGAAEGTVVIQRQHDAEVGRIQQQTEESSRDIHQAPGSSDQIDPSLDRAGRRALCLHDGRANDPQCRELLQPHG